MSRMYAIFPVGKVLDRPNNINYQRLAALASRYRLVVITMEPLPEGLCDKVEKIHLVAGALEMVRTCLAVCARLSGENQRFFIHTQFALTPLSAGFLCRRRFGCRWVYDLWDHPSLVWSERGGLKSLQDLWQGACRAFLKHALYHRHAPSCAVVPARSGTTLSHFPSNSRI